VHRNMLPTKKKGKRDEYYLIPITKKRRKKKGRGKTFRKKAWERGNYNNRPRKKLSKESGVAGHASRLATQNLAQNRTGPDNYCDGTLGGLNCRDWFNKDRGGGFRERKPSKGGSFQTPESGEDPGVLHITAVKDVQ